jgi:hypothetical protein
MNLLTPSHVSESTSMTPTYSPASLALSLVGDVRSLGLVSQLDAPLKNFSKRLLACIRSVDDAVVVEEFRGHEFLSLISRLNQEVAPYLLQKELPFEGSQSMHIWVIDQAQMLSTEQQSIIFRLIELFPALPFRVVWLSNQPLQTWKEHGKTECIYLDLDAVDPGPIELPEPTLVADPVDAAVPQGLAPSNEIDNTSFTLKWPASALSQRMKIGAGLVGAGIVGAVVWMNTGTTPAPSAPVHSVASETTAANPAATPASEASVPSPSAPTPATPAASSPAVPVAASTSPKPAAESKAKAKAQATEASSKPAPAKAANAESKALPDAAQAGARWLKALPADTYVVEHGNAGSFEQAQKLKAKHKELTNARIVAVRKSSGADEWQFTVITGPFRSEDRAKSYVSRLEWKSSTRIRGTDKLKGQVG